MLSSAQCFKGRAQVCTEEVHSAIPRRHFFSTSPTQSCTGHVMLNGTGSLDGGRKLFFFFFKLSIRSRTMFFPLGNLWQWSKEPLINQDNEHEPRLSLGKQDPGPADLLVWDLSTSKYNKYSKGLTQQCCWVTLASKGRVGFLTHHSTLVSRRKHQSKSILPGTWGQG